MDKRIGIVVLGLAALAGNAAAGAPNAAAKPATLRFVAGYNALVGISFGIDAVDAERSVLDRRRTATLASGVHTVWYSCPNEAAPRDGAHITFDFAEGKVYELVCRAGQDAEIRAGGC
jgi:hypothetical protein